MIDVYVEGLSINIGRQGENLARNVYFDLSELINTYGEGTATLVHMRPSDKAPYVCAVTRNGTFLVWSPTNTDTAYAGSGKCELRWVVGETLAKSIVYRTSVTESITGDSTVPSEYESWYEALLEHISEYEIASDQIAANTSQIAANTSDIAVLDGRMDEFTTLTDGSTTGDAELADIRVGYDGTVYSNAGEAVRTQIADVKSDLNDEIPPLYNDIYIKGSNIPMTASTGTWRLDPATGLCVSNSSYMLAKYQVTPGDVLVVDCDDYFQFQTIASVPSSGNSNRVGSTTYGQGTFVVVVPTGATYLIGSSPAKTTAFKVYHALDKADNLEENTSFILSTLDGDYKFAEKEVMLISGKLLYSSGQTGDIASTDWNVSDYIDVSNDTYIKIEASTGYGNLFYAKYTADKTFISGEASGGEISSISKLIYVGDASYIKFSKFFSNLGNALRITGLNPRKWSGKKWVCIGDSLTQVNSTTTKHYFDYVAEETGITTINYGVGGTGYANPNGTAGNFVTRMASVPTDGDVYTIFGSFNDWQYSVDNDLPIGGPTDTGTSSLCGYFNAALDALFTRIPLANLGVVAPCPWAGINAMGTGTFGKDYTDALKAVCERRSVPFLNLYTESGMRPWDSAFREQAYTKDSAGGVHPDETGHAILAPKFKAFLESLLL